MESKKVKATKESPLSAISNLLFNIVLPVIILKRLSPMFGEDGPLIALILALSFPATYFAYEYIKLKQRNWISVLGFVNTLMTGGFALLHLEGIWFAVKEATFPLLIGIFVYLSPKIARVSMVEYMFINPNVFKVDLLKQKLKENKFEAEFKKHLVKTNVFLSYSFFLSAVLNFVLAIYIFTDIPAGLSDNEKSLMLNDQISQMTWKSYIVIFIPSMICLVLIFRYLSKGLQKYTGLKFQELIKQH